MASRFRRTQNVIRPGLQIRVCLLFVTVAGLLLVALAAQMFHSVRDMLDEGVVEKAVLQEHLATITVSKLLMTLAFAVVVVGATAILVTFRMVGPIHRMKMFLERVKQGEQTEPCSLRKGDAFHEFCGLLNDVTEPLRQEAERTAAAPRSERQPADPVSA